MCQKDVSSMVSRCPFCNADLTHVKDSANNNNTYYNPDSDSESTASRDFSESRKQKNDTQSQPPVKRGTDAESGKVPASVSGKRKKNTPPAGRRLLGYRAGNPFYMFISVFYHMAACVGILYAFSLSSQYLGSPALLFHISRVILAAIMLFLPALLLSENRLRTNIPLLRSQNSSAVIMGFVFLYLPLAVLFFISWYFCV